MDVVNNINIIKIEEITKKIIKDKIIIKDEIIIKELTYNDDDDDDDEYVIFE